jgi:hypothetical protein
MALDLATFAHIPDDDPPPAPIPMTVYRVERLCGMGPYRTFDAYGHYFPQGHLIHPDGFDPIRHPPLSFLHGGIDQGSPWYCGFKTRTQFARWFNPAECTRLARLKYFLVEYLVPDSARHVDEDSAQLVFLRKTAELIERVSLHVYGE